MSYFQVVKAWSRLLDSSRHVPCAPAWLRHRLCASTPGSSRDIEDVQRELDSFFGSEFAPTEQQSAQHANASIDSLNAMHATTARVELTSPSSTRHNQDSRHAQPTLTHTQSDGRACMVDVALVCIAPSKIMPDQLDNALRMSVSLG
jgi:hypothetical protein